MNGFIIFPPLICLTNMVKTLFFGWLVSVDFTRSLVINNVFLSGRRMDKWHAGCPVAPLITKISLVAYHVTFNLAGHEANVFLRWRHVKRASELRIGTRRL